MCAAWPTYWAIWGCVAGYQGNYTAALDYYEQSLRLTREIGSRKAECVRLGNMGWLCGLLGDYQKAQTYVEQALQIAREVGDRNTETLSLINLSSHAGAMGQFAPAIEYAEQGLSLARQSSDRNAQAWALTYLGHGLFECGMRTRLGMHTRRPSSCVAIWISRRWLQSLPPAWRAFRLLEGDSASAKMHVDAILAQLEQDGTLEGTDQPLRVYLSCYLVLSGMDDPRAKAILNTAHDMLKTRANGIADPSARQMFLEKITYNREILSLWETRHRG